MKSIPRNSGGRRRKIITCYSAPKHSYHKFQDFHAVVDYNSHDSYEVKALVWKYCPLRISTGIGWSTSTFGSRGQALQNILSLRKQREQGLCFLLSYTYKASH
mmetsp:Transcript_56050/g.167789  ORF Transcript_56050/g.167789 Transcript_56050/m.167789 type:complete len:103 (+) Transcript_56050:704-1012(+)